MHLVPSLPTLKVKSLIKPSCSKAYELENVTTIDESTSGKLVFHPQSMCIIRNINGANKSCFIKEF